MPRKETNRDKPAADSATDKFHDVMSDLVDRALGVVSHDSKPKMPHTP
ncbi:MAG: hypothetical protein JWP89_1436 [Schlesneria sp.]|nr:hypothetical protein [Schlesneria sp.]